MPKRKFQYDKELKKWAETTPEDMRPLCDELTADAKRFDWDGGVKYRPSMRFPYHSEEMGVSLDPETMKQDIAYQQAQLARHGVKTEYDEIGRPIMRSPEHERAHMKVFGYAHMNAGYGDVAPENYVESTHSRTAVMKNRERLHSGIEERDAQLVNEIRNEGGGELLRQLGLT